MSTMAECNICVGNRSSWFCKEECSNNAFRGKIHVKQVALRRKSTESELSEARRYPQYANEVGEAGREG